MSLVPRCVLPIHMTHIANLALRACSCTIQARRRISGNSPASGSAPHRPRSSIPSQASPTLQSYASTCFVPPTCTCRCTSPKRQWSTSLRTGCHIRCSSSCCMSHSTRSILYRRWRVYRLMKPQLLVISILLGGLPLLLSRHYRIFCLLHKQMAPPSVSRDNFGHMWHIMVLLSKQVPTTIFYLYNK